MNRINNSYLAEWMLQKMDCQPVHTTTNHHPEAFSKTDVLSKIILSAKWLVRHLSTVCTSLNQQQRPFPSVFILLLWDPNLV